MKRIPGSYKRIILGTPITPAARWSELDGKSFCVSFAEPRDLDRAIAAVGDNEILLLDNGAFSAWKRGIVIDWADYWAWAIDAMERCPNAVAVIPDVIGGDPDANWMMAAEAVRKYVPRKYTGRLMFVWHMDEPIDVLIDAARLFNFVAIGSCAAFDITKGAKPGTKFYERMQEAWDAIGAVEALGLGERPFVHMMRGLGKLKDFAWDSADSTNVAINYKRWAATNAPTSPAPVKAMVERLSYEINGAAELPLTMKEAA